MQKVWSLKLVFVGFLFTRKYTKIMLIKIHHSTYYFFHNRNNKLIGHHFDTDDDVIVAVDHLQDANLCKQGISMPYNHHTKSGNVMKHKQLGFLKLTAIWGLCVNIRYDFSHHIMV